MQIKITQEKILDSTKNIDYSITFATYNQVEYTKKCIESMSENGEDLSRLVVVDNQSTDKTREYLSSLSLGGLILNNQNLGCGTAWNQGALALQSEWTIIMNNDVIVSPNWIQNLIHSAQENNISVISPALIEGDLDYDLNSFAYDASNKMGNHLRFGGIHAVCLAVHQSVWDQVGYFRAVPKLLGYEDTLFFHELAKANIQTAITGRSWLHHFGSITQSAMKKERGMKNKEGLANRNNHQLLQQSWIRRKLDKINKRRLEKHWLRNEIDQFDMSLHGTRSNEQFTWS